MKIKILIDEIYENDNFFGAKAGDSCIDLRSTELINIPHGETKTVHTGLHLELPDGYEGQVRSRSGFSRKNEIIIVNSPGTIDQGYTGEILVVFHTLGKRDVVIRKGDKIAQLAICPVLQPSKIKFEKVSKLKDTERGSSGFGSTGV